MDIGVTFPADESMTPVEFGRFAEEHGVESVWFSEHSHIPVSRESEFPGGGQLAPMYLRFPDPFVCLAALAVTTERVRLGTGLCQLTQRDPILTAKEVATLDVLSGGRVLFGVGAGWNAEEMRNHGTDPAARFSVLCERVDAIKTIWTEEQASFHGRHVSFDPIWSYPKPAQKPHPPVLMAGDGPKAVERALAHGDGWITNHGMNDPAVTVERVRALRQRVRERGLPESFSVTVVSSPVDADVLRAYAEAGVTRAVVALRPTRYDEPDLERLPRFIDAVRAATASLQSA